MSKKSRRRNKRLALLLTLAGGAALAGRGKKKFGTDAGFLKSGAAGGASLKTPLVDAADAGTTFKKPPIRKDVLPVPKPYDQKEVPGDLYNEWDTIINAPVVKRPIRKPKNLYNEWDTIIQAPEVKRPIRKRTNIYSDTGIAGAKHGGRIGAKHGGRVTGIAKRGFGRALGRGKK